MVANNFFGEWNKIDELFDEIEYNPDSDDYAQYELSEDAKEGIMLILACMIWTAVVCGLGACLRGNFCQDPHHHLNSSSDYQVESEEYIRKAKARLIEKLRNVKMVVKEEFLTDGSDLERDVESLGVFDDDCSSSHRYLALPPYAVAKAASQTTDILEMAASRKNSRVPNSCSICLDGYGPGETVVWSSNPECRHVFHEDCILRWMMTNREPVCPNCRQNFVHPNDSMSHDSELREPLLSPEAIVEVSEAEESDDDGGYQSDSPRLRLTLSLPSQHRANFFMGTLPVASMAASSETAGRSIIA